MTLAEKVNITSDVSGPCTGNSGSVLRLGIPSICQDDGPAGIGGGGITVGITQFSLGVTTAATWDKDLISSRFTDIANEFRGKGIHVAYGPITSGPLGRSPQGGRNYEGYGVDPYFVGVATRLSIEAMQNVGVVAVAKHMIGYEQESLRNEQILIPNPIENVTGQPYSSDIDERTIHEVYLWGFMEAVRAGTGSVMCSYNRLNSTHACEDATSLNGWLKTEGNFQGFVVSDYGAVYSTANSANNGLDQEMALTPFQPLYFGSQLQNAVTSNQVSVQRLNDMVARILTPFYALGQDKGYPTYGASRNVSGNHGAGVRNLDAQAATLLKNVRTTTGSNGTNSSTLGLPLLKPKKIAVIGTDAFPTPGGPNNCGLIGHICMPAPIDIGTVTTGGGSGGNVNAPYVVDPLEALTARAKVDNTTIVTSRSDFDYLGAQHAAIGADAALVFVQAYTHESSDRSDLELRDSTATLIQKVAAVNRNTIVVMSIPGPVIVESFIDSPNVTAVMSVYYAGQEKGNAIVDVLYGLVNPSGKLPFTMGKKLSDWPAPIVSIQTPDPHISFNEKLLVDYRWFDANNIQPRFAFGFGLSYTTFSYSGIVVAKLTPTPEPSVQDTNEKFLGTGNLYDQVYNITATISNTGSVVGSEAAQLYVSFPLSAGEPPVVLRGFDKAKNIQPGSKATVSFVLRNKDISTWDSTRQGWSIPSGAIVVKVGASSRNLPLTAMLT